MEIWKDIEGYEGLYQISNMGRVKSLDRWSIRNKNGISYPICLKGKILANRKIKNGYYIVSLFKDGVETQYRVNRLVAETFIPNPENKPNVDHIDTNPLNNRVDNLRWVTQKENINNPTTLRKMSNSQTGKILSIEHRKKIGEKHKGNAYLRGRYGKDANASKPLLQLSLQNEPIRLWVSREAAKKQVGASKISEVCSGKRNKSGGFKWQYLDDYLADWWEQEMEKAV